MPKFLEDKLKAEYGRDSKVPYKVMNAIGAMHGNQETAKGKAMEKKHEEKVSKPPFRETRIQHHDDGSHTVEHVPHMKSSKSGAFMERGESKSYSAEDGESLIEKLHEHLGIPDGGDEPSESEE